MTCLIAVVIGREVDSWYSFSNDSSVSSFSSELRDDSESSEKNKFFDSAYVCMRAQHKNALFTRREFTAVNTS